MKNYSIVISALFCVLFMSGCNDDVPDTQISNDTDSQSNGGGGGDTNTNPNDSGGDSESSADGDTDADSDADADSEPQGYKELLLQAECVFDDVFSMECLETNGMSSESAVAPWQEQGVDAGGNTEFPALSDDNTFVDYFMGGVWIAFTDIDLTEHTNITINVAGAESESQGFRVLIDSPSGDTLSLLPVGDTGGWDSFTEVTSILIDDITGVHDVYIVAATEGLGNGNIDWVKFHQ